MKLREFVLIVLAGQLAASRMAVLYQLQAARQLFLAQVPQGVSFILLVSVSSWVETSADSACVLSGFSVVLLLHLAIFELTWCCVQCGTPPEPSYHAI